MRREPVREVPVRELPRELLVRELVRERAPVQQPVAVLVLLVLLVLALAPAQRAGLGPLRGRVPRAEGP